MDVAMYFFLGAINIPCAFIARTRVSWLNWFTLGFCWGVGFAKMPNPYF